MFDQRRSSIQAHFDICFQTKTLARLLILLLKSCKTRDDTLDGTFSVIPLNKDEKGRKLAKPNEILIKQKA